MMQLIYDHMLFFLFICVATLNDVVMKYHKAVGEH